MGATPRPGDPEPAVIEACRRGDRKALETVLRQQTPALERLLARLVGPGADLEDLLQNTLIAAVQSFPRFRGEASVRSWMARIAVNVVRQHWRVPEKRRKVKLGLVPADDGADDAPAIDVVADQRERLERLFIHLQSIAPKKRIAFVLHVFEGMSLEEVAALTGASKSATKSRVFWARRALLAKASKDPVLKDMVEENES